MRAFFCAFNDRAVALLSHPLMVAVWWAASAISTGTAIYNPSEVAITLALSFLALAYSSAIAERQLRTEDTDRGRDDALHKKIDDLIRAIPEAHDELAGSEPDPVDNEDPKQ